MKSATVSQLKKELQNSSKEELVDFCIRLVKHKKENKELLTYLIYETEDEDAFVFQVKEEIDELFDTMNTDRYFFMKKTVQKIDRQIKKHIRYSKKTETKIELLLYFCVKLQEMRPAYTGNSIINNIYDRQIVAIKNSIGKLHEDLQYDYQMELVALESE